MLALLRLHALQLRKLLGLWGLGVIVALSVLYWKVSDPNLERQASLWCQLIVAPLALIAALRGDLFAWSLPLGRWSRMTSQILFTLLFSVVGAAGTLALRRALGNSIALPLAALSLSAATAAFVLGTLYLLIEESQAILGGLVLFGALAADFGLTHWQLSEPFSAKELAVLTMLGMIAVVFYSITYLQGESLGREPLTEDVPAPPRFERPPRHEGPPGRVWSARPESSEGKEVLKISKELRSGRSLFYVLILKDWWSYAMLIGLQLFYTLCLTGPIVVQQLAMNSTIQMSVALKRWSHFAHTPISRSRVLSLAIAPALALWITMIVASLVQSAFSDAPNFLCSTIGGHRWEVSPSFSVNDNPELGINSSTLMNFGLSSNVKDWEQDASKMSEILVRFLRAFHGVKTTREELLSLHPGPFPLQRVQGRDPAQLRWMEAIQERFRSELKASLFRRRVYDNLLALLLSCLSLWGVITANSKGLPRMVITVVLALALFLLPMDPEIRVPLFRAFDAVPGLTVTAMILLSALATGLSFRAFQDWTPVTFRKPTHLRIR